MGTWPFYELGDLPSGYRARCARELSSRRLRHNKNRRVRPCLRDADYDKWAAGDLAVGDIHQPLHAATNADRGGTCQRVNAAPPDGNLYFVWDAAG
jgi:hypothetical protein